MPKHSPTQENDSLEELLRKFPVDKYPHTPESRTCKASGDSGYKSESQPRILPGYVEKSQQLQGMYDALSGAFNHPGIAGMWDQIQTHGRSTANWLVNSLEERYNKAVDYLHSIEHHLGYAEQNPIPPVSATSTSRADSNKSLYSRDNGYYDIPWRDGKRPQDLKHTKIQPPLASPMHLSTAAVLTNNYFVEGDDYQSCGANNNRVSQNLRRCYQNSLASTEAGLHNNSTNQTQMNVDEQVIFKQRIMVLKKLVPNLNKNILAIANHVESQQLRVEERYGTGTLKAFNPSYSVLQKLGQDRPQAISGSLPENACSGPSNYQGDITARGNQSADIPDNENCSLWILGLPGNVTHNEFLGAIRNVGKVYTCFINRPTANFDTAAAKLVFFTRSQAEKLMSMMKNGEILVMGKSITKVRWNKIKRGAYTHPDDSRTIRITGPAHLMDFGYFEMFFNLRFTYELDQRCEIPCAEPDKITHEWRFGSLRCQAAAAKMAIERELWNIFEVSWGPDPCDVLWKGRPAKSG